MYLSDFRIKGKITISVIFLIFHIYDLEDKGLSLTASIPHITQYLKF